MGLICQDSTKALVLKRQQNSVCNMGLNGGRLIALDLRHVGRVLEHCYDKYSCHCGIQTNVEQLSVLFSEIGKISIILT